MNDHKIKILVVDDHPLMREALQGLIETEPDLKVIGQASNGESAVEMAARMQPDVVVMDIIMPGIDGIEATRQIIKTCPGVHVLILTSSNDDTHVVAAMRAGAEGFLIKDAGRKEVIQGIREVAAGNIYLPADVARKLANAIQDETLLSKSGLTDRQKQILSCIGRGYTNQQISTELVLSEATVRVHIFNILQKLKLHDRSDLIAYASKMHMI